MEISSSGHIASIRLPFISLFLPIFIVSQFSFRVIWHGRSATHVSRREHRFFANIIAHKLPDQCPALQKAGKEKTNKINTLEQGKQGPKHSETKAIN